MFSYIQSCIALPVVDLIICTLFILVSVEESNLLVAKKEILTSLPNLCNECTGKILSQSSSEGSGRPDPAQASIKNYFSQEGSRLEYQ